MAFPTTITTDGLGTQGCAGPYLSSGGNVYVVIVDDQRFDLRALKATDPASSFAGVGTDVVVGAGADLINSIAGYQVGDVIHILSKNSNGSDPVDIRYHTFNMSTDAWVVTNEMLKTNMSLGSGQGGWRCPIGIVVRADGVVIAIYNGPTETVATVAYDRVYYARRTAGTWTADIALGTAGVAASWLGGVAILGAADRVHFYFADDTNGDLYPRTITSAYSMEALPAALDINISDDPENSWAQRGAYITASGVVSYPWYEGFQTIYRAVATSVDAPVYSIDADITGARAVLTAPLKYVASHAVDGTTLWNVFIDTANDIYTQSNANGAGWSTPALFQAGSASAVYANVYTRGASLVLGVVYHDTDPKYSEFTLSTSAVASISLPNGGMLSRVGR